jgi:RNA methyltransferase, TrmH family
VKRAASLHQRKFRDREGAFLVEGADLVMAGLAAGHRPQVIFVRAERAEELVLRLGLAGEAGGVSVAGEAYGTPGGRTAEPPPAIYPVAEHVAHKIGTLDAPADVMAVFPLPERCRFAPPPGSGDDLLVLYVDAVGDPGNVGTLLRAAVAFGAGAFVAAPGTADLFGPKTVRAGMGAVFALPLYQDVPLADVLARLPGAEVVGLAAHDGEPLDRAALARPAVLVVGAERAGISPQAAPHVTRPVTIALAPGRPQAVESLNAGVAGAIALYEFSRRQAGAYERPPSPAAAKEG